MADTPTFHGVDFSGAARPGDDIWLATVADGRVTACRSAREAFDATGRDDVLGALREWLATADGPVGLDFSFGLPRALLPPLDDWPAFLAWFRDEFADADGRTMQTRLKDRARAGATDGVELKRATDGPVGASSPYSFITRYQTLHGVRDVLAPLVLDGRAGVEPLAPADGPTLCEIYPASALRALDLPDERYKGAHAGERARRERIVAGLREHVRLDDATADLLVAEGGGDALDAVVAALTVSRVAEAGFAVDADRYDPLEGYIYTPR
ncbi:DUF429 domain-containing protein [Halosegnis marinus]|uniref:DUF429 domain-containing protein n=1 Tax=Halosegnis marinus TaxID=3034023 RepID=UPI00362310FA